MAWNTCDKSTLPARCSRRSLKRQRRGIATLWTILFVPVLTIFLIMVVEISFLWLARVELENALEAAALAAVTEWGRAGGGSTYIPRQIGVEYAWSNGINGDPVAIETNFANPPNSSVNENQSCDGDLVFGAILENPITGGLIFNADIPPGCGPGTVLVDASEQGDLADDNAWGIAFRRTPRTPPALQIQRVIIDLQAGGGDGLFDFTQQLPVLSDDSPRAVVDGAQNSQPDISGFSDPAAQIAFTPSTGTSPTLTIDFGPDPSGGDLGFEPCDRFRFGARTSGVSKGSGGDDGDGIGRDDVQVTIFFTLGGFPLPPVTATFFDNEETSNDCEKGVAPTEPECGSMIVHPAKIPDLPCPPSSAPKNNGQSYATIQGGGNAFGVIGQKTLAMEGLICQFCGIPIGPYSVSAKTIAMYDCLERRPRLVRVEEIICTPPVPFVLPLFEF